MVILSGFDKNNIITPRRRNPAKMYDAKKTLENGVEGVLFETKQKRFKMVIGEDVLKLLFTCIIIISIKKPCFTKAGRYSWWYFACWWKFYLLIHIGDCLSRVDFPSWFALRKDIRTVKTTLSISKISLPKSHVRPLLIGIYCIDLLVSHLNTSIIIFIFSKLARDIWWLLW